MTLLSANNTEQIPQYFTGMHKSLSFIFMLSFFVFLVTLGLSGWVRSRILGIFSSIISLTSLVLFVVIMSHFLV